MGPTFGRHRETRHLRGAWLAEEGNSCRLLVPSCAAAARRRRRRSVAAAAVRASRRRRDSLQQSPWRRCLEGVLWTPDTGTGHPDRPERRTQTGLTAAARAGGSCWSDGRYGGLTHNASDGPGEFCERQKKFSFGPYLRTEFRSSPSTAKNLQITTHPTSIKIQNQRKCSPKIV